MTIAELKCEIETGPLSAEFVDKSDNEIAELLNSTLKFTAVKSRFITARTILAELGPEMGASVLDKMEAASTQDSPVKWAFKFLMSDGIDIGFSGTRAQVDALVSAQVLTEEEGSKLKDTALYPASRCEVLGWSPVTYDQVNAARRL